MTMQLIDNASTLSRARRPLRPNVVRSTTLETFGARERVRLEYANGHTEEKTLLSWVIGQAGLFWGGGPFPPEIEYALTRYSRDVHGSYGHFHEHRLAEALGSILDGVFTSNDIGCRFGMNGKDALDAAARIARTATGRKYVASNGYHGGGEAWVHPPYPEGIPEEYKKLSLRFEWGDVATLRRCAMMSAAICIEVPALPDEEIIPFLRECQRACQDTGSIFILDEVVTGFRFNLRGAAGYYSIKPDIACYGKALSATCGISAIVGRRDLLELLGQRTFFSLTAGGHPRDCAIAAATLNWLSGHQQEVYAPDGHLRRIGQALKDGLNEIGIKVIGQPERSIMLFDTEAHRRAFCSQMIACGVVVDRPFFPTLAHTLQDVELTLEAARQALRASSIK